MADSVPLRRLPAMNYGDSAFSEISGLLTRRRAHRVRTVRRGSRPFKSLCPSTEQTNSGQREAMAPKHCDSLRGPPREPVFPG